MNPSCSHICNNIFKTRKKCWTGRGGRTKGNEKWQCKHQCKRRSREGATDAGAETLLQPLAQPTLKQRSERGLARPHARAVFAPVQPQLMEEPTLEERKGIKWKEKLRRSAADWLCPSPSLTVLLVGWVAGSEKSEVVTGRRREEMLFCSIVCLCFSLPESIFIGNTWNSFSSSQGCFTHNSNWYAVFLTLSQPTSFLILFSSPAPWGGVGVQLGGYLALSSG